MRWDITTELSKTKTTRQNIMQIDYGRLATEFRVTFSHQCEFQRVLGLTCAKHVVGHVPTNIELYGMQLAEEQTFQQVIRQVPCQEG